MICFHKGMTLIEILIGLAILVIILVTALPQFSSFKTEQVLKSATSDVLSSLDKARSQSLNSLDSSEYGVHFQSDKVVIFKGTVYSANSSSNEDIVLATSSTISTITLSGGGSDIYFARLSATPSKTGTITISSGSYTKTITIGATGIFSSN